MYKPVRKNKGGYLLKKYNIAHDLCIILHDQMLNIVKSESSLQIFSPKIYIDSEDEFNSLKKADNILDWLAEKKSTEHRASANRTLIFPYLLSDLLMCLYESLEASRKGKITPAYMLIRKPLQENLFLLERIFLDEIDFSEKYSNSPLDLRPKTAGGMEGHVKRIQQVLKELGEEARFDAEFIAQLRYSKEGGFDGLCNKAIHLFTEHKSIKTEPYNTNFIFISSDSLEFYWKYFYSFLPYLLIYIQILVENIMSRIAFTVEEHTQYFFRKTAALTLMWASQFENDDFFVTDEHEKLFLKTRSLLNLHCQNHAFRKPWKKDLSRMARTGAFPGEKKEKVTDRLKLLQKMAEVCNVLNSEDPNNPSDSFPKHIDLYIEA